MTEQTTVRAAVYCRISMDRTGAGLGVARQRADCEKLAHHLGWRIVDLYVDNDVSAYSGRARPEYERLLKAIDAGQVNAVVAWHQDRLNRSPLELERLIALLEERDVAVQTVTSGLVDLSTASGRAIARTLGAWARYESEHRSERIRAQKRDRALRGLPSGGRRRPYGYADDLVSIDPEEAKVIGWMMRRFLAGTPLGVIRRDLQRRGVPGPTGGDWETTTIARILQSPRIAGWQQETGLGRGAVARPFLARVQWPAIVSRREVERAQAIYNDDTRRPGATNTHLLSGIAVCGACRLPLTCTLHGRGDHRRYLCDKRGRSNAVSVSISQPDLDRIVIDQLVDAVAGGVVRQHLKNAVPSQADLAETVRANRTLLASTVRAANEGLLTADDFVHRKALYRHRLDRAELLLADGPQPHQLAELARERDDFRRSFETLELRAQRAVIRTLASEVSLLPKATDRKDQSARIRITWNA